MGVAPPGEERDRSIRLHAAFVAGDLEAVRAELGDPDGFPNVSAGPAFGNCLVYAIYHGPMDLIGRLVDEGADPDADEGDGYPPLIAALSGDPGQAGAREVVELLLRVGADVNRRGVNGYTPLHVVAAAGDLEMVDRLLAHGADPNAITGIDDLETPVEVASTAGHADIVERLRPLTIRLDWEDASRAGDVAVLQRMLDAGQVVDATDGYGQTALMRAAHAGRADAVGLLIARGADLDRSAKFGLTALMLAVVQGHGGVALALVAAGADRTRTGTGAPGFAGKSAADLAADRGDLRLAERLAP